MKELTKETITNKNMMSNRVAKRMTKQRKMIKDILCNSKQHPTAEAIYEEARLHLPDISLGTVYRNLQVLLDEGSIIELSYGKKYSRFDGNTKPHYHFICEECGKIYDLDIPFNYDFLNRASCAVDGEISHYRLEFYGRCNDCVAKSPVKIAVGSEK